MTNTEKNSKKPVTLETLSEQIGKVDKKVDDLSANLDKKIDNLAGITKRGFDDVDKSLQDLEIGQEDIKLRLDRAAWKFEMDALDERVKTLEDKVGVVREKR